MVRFRVGCRSGKKYTVKAYPHKKFEFDNLGSKKEVKFIKMFKDQAIMELERYCYTPEVTFLISKYYPD